MSQFEEDLLFGCLEQVQAWEMLHNPQVVGTLNTEEFFELCKTAGYSKQAAQKAASAWAWKRMQKELPL